MVRMLPTIKAGVSSIFVGESVPENTSSERTDLEIGLVESYRAKMTRTSAIQREV